MMTKQKKLLGIIGGMGAEAGAYLYGRIVKLTPAASDQDHIKTMLFSNTEIPDRTSAILKNGPDPFPYLLESAQVLERCGVEIIILACVTSHYYLPQLRKEVTCEILSAVEETLDVLEANYPGTRRIGILATTGTIRAGLFQDALISAGREPVVMSDEYQDSLYMDAIYGPDGIKAGSLSSGREKIMEAVGILAESGADAIILGCSELPLVIGQEDSKVPLIDCMDILARKAVLRCSGSQPKG
jgi:aspartate racemase